jgi:hypothetical protein
MQPIKTTQANPAPGVVPTPQPSVAWRVVAVDPQPDLRLHVRFIDGTSGEVMLRSFLTSSQVTGTIFEPLRDPEVFRQVRVEMGVVSWPNGADLAPDAMYDSIRTHGHWMVEE